MNTLLSFALSLARCYAQVLSVLLDKPGASVRSQ